MFDRQLIAKYLDREIQARGSLNAFASSSGVSRATLYRALEAHESVMIGTYRRIERGLDLPFDTFASLASHDFAVLQEMGIDQGVVRWLERQAKESVPSAPSTSRKRSTRATGRGSAKA